jgi:MotA/TolQ/ExbB proton channel family
MNAQPLHLWIAGGLLATLVLSFLGLFLLPGVLHWLRLRRLQRELLAFELRTPPGEFRKLFAKDARLSHLWKEYQDSLHIQREERDGQMVPVAVRSTLPAETFFNSQYVVDARLRTEFFKHLPGIFTGIGIIGTFTGLIEGLQQFQVSENAATVRASLESLMHSVGQAFLISASAIAAAMVVTFLEKLLLSSLYGRTEDIAHAIDARFDAGAGEDYLSRLVKSSEDSAAQSTALKDALVKELAGVLREQTDLQIQAARADAAGLATAISASIERSLQPPLQKIALAVQTSTGDQSAQTSQLLQDVMGRFGDRLNDVLGGQVSGIQELNQQTGQAMQDAALALRQLVEKMSDTSRESSNAMSANLQSTLQAVEQQVGSMLATLGDNQQQAAEGQRVRELAMAEQSTSAIDSVSEMLGHAMSEMSGASAQMARSIDALTQTTSTALDRMNTGAEALSVASRSFAAAGDRVGGVMEQAADVSAKLVQASDSMGLSATDLRGGLDDYRSHREAVGHVVTELRTTVELARKEAAITADVLARIQQSSERLGQAQQHTDQYLNGVSKVLGDAHQAFAVGVKKTLELANMEFHAKLSTAVGLLSSTVVELEATLGHATPQRH